MTRKEKQWRCPHCPQTSNRHWNLKIHIRRNHDRIGHPIQADSPTSNINTVSSQFIPDTMKNFVDEARYRNASSYHSRRGYYYPSEQSIFPTEVPKNEEEPQKTDPIHILRENNEWLSELVKRNNLLSQLRTLQQPTMMNNIFMWQLLNSLSNSNIFQNNNNKNMTDDNNQLPTGYRVRFCNTCLSGNRLESILASTIELDAITKINHICELESSSRASSMLEQQRQQASLKGNSPTNITKQAQVMLICLLTEIVNLRISHQEGIDLRLKAHEIYDYQLLMHLIKDKNKKLPENKSLIQEEDYLDVGDIGHSNNMAKEKHWAYRVIKEEGFTKIIKINKNELMDFVNIAKATFGAFRVKVADGGQRYFLMCILF